MIAWLVCFHSFWNALKTHTPMFPPYSCTLNSWLSISLLSSFISLPFPRLSPLSRSCTFNFPPPFSSPHHALRSPWLYLYHTKGQIIVPGVLFSFWYKGGGGDGMGWKFDRAGRGGEADGKRKRNRRGDLEKNGFREGDGDWGVGFQIPVLKRTPLHFKPQVFNEESVRRTWSSATGVTEMDL